jgi:hypothetical protein
VHAREVTRRHAGLPGTSREHHSTHDTPQDTRHTPRGQQAMAGVSFLDRKVYFRVGEPGWRRVAHTSRPPTFYIHAGSWSTTGIEPDSVPAARLPEGEPEPRHTCLRCLVRWKGMGRLQGVVGLVTSILLRVASPSTVSPLEGTWHTQSSDASSGVVSERQTWSNPPVFVTGDSGESCCCLLGGSSPLLR